MPKVNPQEYADEIADPNDFDSGEGDFVVDDIEMDDEQWYAMQAQRAPKASFLDVVRVTASARRD